MKFRFIQFLLLGLLAAGCNLEQEVDISLPEYERRPVVEAYLEPGKPYRILITQSDEYFAAFPGLEDFPGGILLDSASVTISHRGAAVELRNELTFDPTVGKLFNYVAEELVPEHTGELFELSIEYPNGDFTRAETELLPRVSIDSVVVEFPDTEQDTFARVLTYFTDDPSVSNFYRRMLHFSSLDSIPEQDFVADDQIVEDSIVLFGTGFDYAEGDTIINTLYHISEDYATFLQSLEAAVSSNGNPFGQPSPIISNLEGSANAIGIFTGLIYDRRRTIIERN